MWILRRAASEKLRGRPCQEQTHVLIEHFSSMEQDVRSQRLAILEYARQHDFCIDGDRLIVSELSRLGRSLGQIVAILDALAKRPASLSWR